MLSFVLINFCFYFSSCLFNNRRRQNVARTSATHPAFASYATFLFLPHFDMFHDLLLNRRTGAWNLFVKFPITLYNFYNDPAKGSKKAD